MARTNPRDAIFTKEADGSVTWKSEPGDSYVVTGVYYSSLRHFRPIYTVNYNYAMSINLYRGSVWLLRNGRRYLIKRVYN